MSKKKNDSVKKNDAKYETKKRTGKIIVVSLCAAGIVCAALITFFVMKSSSEHSQICNIAWTSTSAKSASGDEVDMSKIYNTNYSSYKGSLNFTEDGKFSLWLTPGSPDDGTHNGKYLFDGKNKLNVEFEDGTKTSFTLKYKNENVVSILVPYNDYNVMFTK